MISVDSSHRYDATEFKDTKRTSVADKLDGILRLVEYHAFEEEQREIARKAEERRRRAAWERVRAQAEVDLQEHARRLVFDEQMASWEMHHRRAAYLEALAELWPASRGSRERMRKSGWDC